MDQPRALTPFIIPFSYRHLSHFTLTFTLTEIPEGYRIVNFPSPQLSIFTCRLLGYLLPFTLNGIILLTISKSISTHFLNSQYLTYCSNTWKKRNSTGSPRCILHLYTVDTWSVCINLPYTNMHIFLVIFIVLYHATLSYA